MKKTLFTCLLACLLTLTACAPSAAPPAPEEDTLRILATTYPVYLFTTAVTEGVEGVRVDLLVNQQTSCLHDYTLTVTDMKAVEGADVVVMNGAGLEDFLSDALAASDAAVVDCSEGIELRTLPDGDPDPHIWMTGEGAAVMLNNVQRGLGALDGAHQEDYLANAQAAIGLLPADPLAAAEIAHPYLITFHDGFQYFAHDNGLTLLKSIEEEEGSEASAKDINEIVSLIEEYSLPAIFTEVNGSDATARAIARETGVEVCRLDLIMSGAGSGIQPYLDAMKANYDTVLEALG